MIARMRAAETVWLLTRGNFSWWNPDSFVILMQQRLQIPFWFCNLCWWLFKLLSDKISQNYTVQSACKNCWSRNNDCMWLSTVVPSISCAWQYTVVVEDSIRGSLMEGMWEFYVWLQFVYFFVLLLFFFLVFKASHGTIYIYKLQLFVS